MAIETVRLAVDDDWWLTELRVSDEAALVGHLNDPTIHELTLRIPRPYTPADAQAFLEITRSATQRYGRPIHFAVRNRVEALAGVCSFEGLVQGHQAEIGYWIARPWWGRGLATRVVRRLCQEAWDNWRLVRITAGVFAGNQASARVLEKNAFVREGTLRKAYWKNGKFLDGWLYAHVRADH